MKKKSFRQGISLLSVFLFLNCSGPINKIDNGGVINGNPLITGSVITQDGLPASNALVKLVPFDNNPVNGDTVIAYTLTDDTGGYSFDSISPGVYNVFGETADKKLSFKDSLTISSNNKTLSPNTIKKPGIVKGVISLQPYQPGMVLILLLGTNTYMSTVDTIGNFTSPKLPEGTYDALIISTLPDFNDTIVNLTIESGKTTVLDTIRIHYVHLPPDSALLEKFRASSSHLPGTYTGIVTTPWIPPYPVAFIIDSTGHYSAYNISGLDYPALYYGTDEDADNKKISLVQINANGKINGTIKVVFDVGTNVMGDIRELSFNSGFDSLYFDMYHSKNYGPIHFDLRRIQPDSLPPRPLPTPRIQAIGQFDSDTTINKLKFIDSVTVTFYSSTNYPVFYQLIVTPSSFEQFGNFPADQYWDNNTESKQYSSTFVIKKESEDYLLLARVENGTAKSSVAGYRIRFK